MSVGFSTIRPMDPATISKAPAYSKNNQQPAASSPIDDAQQPKKKKSHWFLKTLVAAAVVVGGAALLRGKVDMFKNFNPETALAEGAKFADKAKYYAQKAVAAVGDFTTKYYNKAADWVKNLIPKAEKAAEKAAEAAPKA